MKINPKLKPELTREQEDWICYVIGAWYIEYEDRIKDHKSLRNAKEILKQLICYGKIEYNNPAD